MEEEIASKDDLLIESDLEDKMTYVNQGELLIIQRSLRVGHDESENSIVAIFFTLVVVIYF
jgi:hypothetical protein